MSTDQSADEPVRNIMTPEDAQALMKRNNHLLDLLREVYRDGLLPTTLRQKVWEVVNDAAT